MESTIGEGSVFYAELPYVRPRILLVDDEEDARMPLKCCLEKEDADIIEAESGEEALKILKENEIHLIVTDIRMPVMDGFELLEKVKKDPETESIPVIVMTGMKLKSKEKALQLGADDFISRPLDMEKFIQKIKNIVI